MDTAPAGPPAVVVDFRDFGRAISGERGTTGISKIQAIVWYLFQGISCEFDQKIRSNRILSERFGIFESLISEKLPMLRYVIFHLVCC